MKGTGFDISNDGYDQWSPEGESWFLGIGIDEYQDGQKFRKLHNAVKDVMDIGNLLNENYLIDKFEFLLNDKATRRAIINTLHRLAIKLTENDKLLIYFSGHGYKEELDSTLSFTFWVPVDAQHDDPSSVISNDAIIEYLKKIKARHIFLISDSCYSGTFLNSRSIVQRIPDLDFAKRLENYRSRWGLFSAEGNQIAADGIPNKNSPFASAILTVLSQHQDQFINAGLFVEEVARQAKRNAPDQDAVYNPINRCGHENGQYIFWRRKEKIAFPISPPEDDNENIDETSDKIPPPPPDNQPLTQTYDKKEQTNERILRDEAPQKPKYSNYDIKKPEDLSSMTPRQIAEEFEKWADIFLNGIVNPERLYKVNYAKMGLMQTFLKALLQEATISGKIPHPVTLSNKVISKLSNLKSELGRSYNKEKTPSEKVLEKIPELYELLIGLKDQYRKLSL
ncbi:MAG: caspase family protein [Phaeodactylibacter sp.]|nr:caspase family protein [Phaeodactylibacter sp.]